MSRKLITGRSVLLDGEYLGPASITIAEGKIQNIEKGKYGCDRTEQFSEVIDAGDLVVMPGLVDSHVHVNEPGRTAWEGFRTATRAAAAGGFTTIVDMPLNSIPPTTSLKGLEVKLQEAREQCFVDVAFWGGVVPGNQGELKSMLRAGVRGFKCFLVNSGVEEFQHVTEADLRLALPQLQGTGGVLLFHAEVETADAEQTQNSDVQQYTTFLNSRPDSMEVEAIKMVCKLCTEYGVRCHIVHLSSAKAIPIIAEAKASGAELTVETCHHYLNFDAETIPDKATHLKCCPPIRSKENQSSLWSALKSGVIDMVVSDHSPCTADLKFLDSGHFMDAWGGISSVQFGVSVFWSAAQARGFNLHDLVRLMAERTARLCRLDDHKGALRIGYDADMIIWDPYATWTITQDKIHHKNKVTPYLNKCVQGVIHKTILRGETVYENGEVLPEARGKLLLQELV